MRRRGIQQTSNTVLALTVALQGRPHTSFATDGPPAPASVDAAAVGRHDSRSLPCRSS